MMRRYVREKGTGGGQKSRGFEDIEWSNKVADLHKPIHKAASDSHSDL
jgi:hypothetical protein